MEKISPLQLNRVGGTSSFKRRDIYHDKCIQDVVPQNPSRDLSYVDSRCLHMLSPYTLLGVLPKQISNPQNLRNLVSKNPQLIKMLKDNNLDISNGDFENFLKYSDEHMRQTALIAGKLCDELRFPKDRQRVVKAARLHDMGKIFIPAKILNKPDNLTPEEKNIMNVHSDLGYQLLSSLNIDEKTLDLIKNHHNFNCNSSIEQQIVSAADVYAALTEKRPYKTSMSSEKALQIMRNSDFSNEILSALEKIAA